MTLTVINRKQGFCVAFKCLLHKCEHQVKQKVIVETEPSAKRAALPLQACLEDSSSKTETRACLHLLATQPVPFHAP